METQQKFRTGNLRKQSTFRNVTTGFPAKWRLWNERRNSILMTCHYPVFSLGKHPFLLALRRWGRFEERGGTDVFAGYPVLGLRKIFFRHERLKEKRKRNTKSLRGLSRTFAWRMHSFLAGVSDIIFFRVTLVLTPCSLGNCHNFYLWQNREKSRIIILKGSNIE